MANKAQILNSSIWLGIGLVIGWCTSKWISWVTRYIAQLLWPMGPLKLERPLVTFDIESTGLNVSRDRVLEIAAVKLMPNGSVVVKGPQRLNPGVAISAEVTAIHGISAADVADCPRFEEVAEEWKAFLEGCDLHGYNAKKFDVPMLRNEFRRCGIISFPPLGVPVVDSFRIFCQQEPRTLGAAVQFYCGRSHEGAAAHTALADAMATLSVLVEQVRRYSSLPRSVPGLVEVCSRPSRAQDITGDGKFQWKGELPVLGFGKYAGEPLAVLISRHKDYLRWMSGQDYSDESLIVVEQALKGMLPTKDGGWQPLVFEPPPAPAASAAPAATSPAETGTEAGGQAMASDKLPAAASAAQEIPATSTSAAASDQPAPPPPPPPQQQQQEASGSTTGSNSTRSSSRRGSKSATRHLQQQQQDEAAAAPVSTAPTGWPEVESSQEGHDQDSWAAVASDNAADSWGSAAQQGSLDGWSIVDPTPQEQANPGPQKPHLEAEYPSEAVQQGE